MRLKQLEISGVKDLIGLSGSVFKAPRQIYCNFLLMLLALH